MTIEGCRVRLWPNEDGSLRLDVLGPNGGVHARVNIRNPDSLRILARGFADAVPADVIPLRR